MSRPEIHTLEVTLDAALEALTESEAAMTPELALLHALRGLGFGLVAIAQAVDGGGGELAEAVDAAGVRLASALDGDEVRR